MVVSLVGLSAAITIIVVLARRKWLPHTGSPQLSVLQTPVKRKPSLLMPDMRVPTIRIPSIRMPTIHIPTLQVPTIRIPALQLPAIRIPTFQMPALRMPAVPTPSWCTGKRRREPPPFVGTEEKPPMFYVRPRPCLCPLFLLNG